MYIHFNIFIILVRSHFFILVFSDDNESPATQVEINFLHYVSGRYWGLTKCEYMFQEDPNSLEIYKMLKNKNK